MPLFQNTNASPNVYNRLPQSIKNFRAALANSTAGIAKTNILCIGDSTTFGTGSMAGLYGPGVKNNSYPTALSNRFNSLGFKSGAQNCFGDAGYGANIPTYDPRLTIGSWAVVSNIVSICGETYAATAATATPMKFTPTVATDTCEIYYISGNGTAAAFNANVNGGANTVVQTWTGLAWNISKVVISGSLGMNNYQCSWASGGEVFIIGFSAYSSVNHEVSVINLGWGGSTAESQLGAFPSMAVSLAAFNPSLVILQTGINDWFGSTALSTYQSSVASWIAAVPANCDIVMVSPLQSSSANSPFATQAPYDQTFSNAATAGSYMYVDLNGRSGGFTAANALGLMASDGTHGSAAMYNDEGNFLANLLTNT